MPANRNRVRYRGAAERGKAPVHAARVQGGYYQAPTTPHERTSSAPRRIPANGLAKPQTACSRPCLFIGLFAGISLAPLLRLHAAGTRRVPNPDTLRGFQATATGEVPDESAQGFAPGSASAARARTSTKTALSSVGRGSGCTCSPSYYVFSRDRDGRPVKGARVKDRKTAERALAAAQREIDEGRVGIAKPKNITLLRLGRRVRADPRRADRLRRASPAHEGLLREHAQPWPGDVRVALPARDRQPRATPLPRTVHGSEACLAAPLPARVERLPRGRGR